MGFSPDFLDEIRQRLPVADGIARRMRLARRGREYLGLCPFHNEKTPSFTVNEEKGFFHCFGCGAHGDLVEFVMRKDGLSFPEAVERLAHEAGLEIPVSTPEERAREKERHTLLGVAETACAWFEEQLAGSRKAREYLLGRGFDKETIARFRLGFAPDGRRTLKLALKGKGIPEELLLGAGLVIKPEDGGESYDRFRNRVIFPIADRRGKVIAFGGRALGDDKAKYLNSPETPLFQKGRVLYAFAVARPAMHETGEAIVTEGYTDVIALHQAGFANAVSPLGTALTEAQILELWRVVEEPVLCFDGDEAGRLAAARAAERALPLLMPGKSLRFATLPADEDPDSLIARKGAAAMREVIGAAQPLADVIWEMQTAARPSDTPERRADLEKRLEERARRIRERKVQDQYLRLFRNRLWETYRVSRAAAVTGKPGVLAQNEGRGGRSRTDRRLLMQRILMAVVINHPGMLPEFAEDLGGLDFSSPELDKLRQETLQLSGILPLDNAALVDQLKVRGHESVLRSVAARNILMHAPFARPEASAEDVRQGWREICRLYHRLPGMQADVKEAGRAFAQSGSPEDTERLVNLKRQELEAGTVSENAGAGPGNEDDG